jgi:DNA repair exonuclease SbcCD ATPase subunit
MSGRSYERATILIGKEMGEIKATLKTFSRDLINIFDKNKEIVESFRLISLIKLKLIQVEKIENELQKIGREIISLNHEVNEKEKENIKILAEIDAIKKSPEYLEKQGRQEKIKILKNELEKDILELRKLIDFKALRNFHHIFEDKIQIVTAHRDDFQTNFQKDNGKGILSLLETAKLNNKEIFEQLSQIHKKKEEILQIETQLENEKDKDRTNGLYSASTKTILEMGDLKNKKSREEKRLEKLKTDKEKIISELKESLEKLGAELD